MRRKRRRIRQGKRINRWQHGLVVVVGVVAVLFIAFFVLTNVVFAVKNVEYSGSFSVDPNEITRASGIRFGRSIFGVDESTVRDRVNALGVVALEDVVIHYPSTVTLCVRDRTDQAMLVYSGGVAILDEEGCVIRSSTEVPNEDLLYVTGFHVFQCRTGAPIDAQMGQRNAFTAVMQALIVNGAKPYVSELDLEDVNNLFLLTRGGITVRLGGMENMYNKIAWMKGAVADLEARGEYGGALDVQSGTKADYIPPSPLD